MTRAPFYYSDELMKYDMGPNHPLRPRRLRLTVDLMASYGLFDTSLELRKPAHADSEELQLTHTPEYLEALWQLDNGKASRVLHKYGLGTGDNPVFDGIYAASLLYAGASIQAAQSVLDGASRAFNISGGLHHAQAGNASGFCVLNDCAAAIRRLKLGFDKVAYVDIDVHHGDGVQALFYNDPTVLTVSIHECARGFYPGTGYVDEAGSGEGTGFSVNVPVAPYTSDDIWLETWRSCALPVLEAFAPDAIVLQLGADPHYLDPLAHVCLTAQGWLEAVKDVNALGLPTVALGGGGYNLTTVTRMWTLAAATLTGVDLKDETPEGFPQRSAIPALFDAEEPDIPQRHLDGAREYADETRRQVQSLIFPHFGL